MSGRVVRVQPRASWPDKVVPGLSYIVTVDASVDGDWPYEEEEFQVGCTVDGSPGLAVEAIGNPALVLHRFGGSYGPARFLLHASELPDEAQAGLQVTLFTAGGLPFHSVRLSVAKDDVQKRLAMPLTSVGTVSAQAPAPRRYTFEPLPPFSPPPYPAWPSRLLAAANEVVPFVLRDAELADLASWLHDGENMLARLLHGPGGQGKTRLVTEFARRSARTGWAVLMARPRPEGPGPAEGVATADTPTSEPASLLVIVDYAERWSAEDLVELFNDLQRREGRTRVLLQARTAGSWWEVVATELQELGIDGYATALSPLTDNPENRRKIYAAAVARFAELYGIKISPAQLRRPGCPRRGPGLPAGTDRPYGRAHAGGRGGPRDKARRQARAPIGGPAGTREGTLGRASADGNDTDVRRSDEPRSVLCGADRSGTACGGSRDTGPYGCRSRRGLCADHPGPHAVLSGRRSPDRA